MGQQYCRMNIGCLAELATLYDTSNVLEIESNDVEIYPNPANDVITVKGEVASIEIYDLVGKCVKTVWKNMEEIRISDLSSGLYMMRIFTPNGNIVTKKFIKK